MFVSHRYQLVFLEVPRTGTHSITRALHEIDPDSPTARQRQSGNPFFAYHDFRVPDDLHGYTIVAGHRNPYSRLWSFWKHRNKTGNPPVFRSVSWHEYVQWVCDPESVPRITGANRDKPVTEMLQFEQIDHWLRFDHLEQDWKDLSDKLGLPPYDLEHLNRSRDQGNFRSAYDQWLAGKVYRRFERDFQVFGYGADSWRRNDVQDSDGPRDDRSGKVTGTTGSTGGGYRARVAVLTNFVKSDPAYSLNRVVQDQIAMLVEHGYAPRVLVIESPAWKEAPGNYALPGVEIVELPGIPGALQPESTDAKEDMMFDALKAALQDIDAVLTHDIIYQPAARIINAAAFRVARENPSMKWLHWVHSATNVADLFANNNLEPGPEHYIGSWANAMPVCFSHMSAVRVAESFGCAESDVRVVPHPIDVCRFFGLSEYATGLYHSQKLYQADYVTTLPARLDRGKQVEWLIKIMSRLKSAGESIRLLIMDFHSQDAAKSEYRSELKSIAEHWDVTGNELLFLSEYSETTRRQSPHALVRELLLLSNLFILPSRSESYSLAAQEAAVAGNLLVLNDDFPPMREIYGENALYFKFSANIDRTNLLEGFTQSEYADVESEVRPAGFLDNQVYRDNGKWYVKGEAVYADYVASCIRNEFNQSKALAQKRDRLRSRNLFTVFERYLEPLLYA